MTVGMREKLQTQALAREIKPSGPDYLNKLRIPVVVGQMLGNI
jgi:hypothetical protein